MGGSILNSREAKEAVNFHDMPQKLETKLETADIIPFYAAYMDIDRTPATGFAMGDVCLMYEPRDAATRNGRIVRRISKTRRRTYIHIYRGR